MPRADRLPHLGLALAMAVSAALLLWTSRGFTFYNDEVGWYSSAPPDYDPGALLRPHNTHLIALPRLVYTASLDLFGPDYLPLRVVAVVGVLACAGLFFVLARRRIGALGALAPALVLLFFGTAWNVVVSPIGIPFLFATAFGLGALVALERGDRRGDVAACVLAVASLASHSIGVSFLAGVAVSVLLRGDRLRRLWVFGVPLVLYAVWWVVAGGSVGAQQSLADPSNLLGLPVFMLKSLGAVLTAVTGLNLAVGGDAVAGFNRPPEFAWSLVPVLAVAGLVALAFGLRRRRFGPALWVFAVILLAFWVSIGLSAGSGRQPTTTRYLFPGAVMLLLVAVEVMRGARLRRPALTGLFAVAALSVVTNVIHIQEARRFLTAYAANVEPTLAMIELAGSGGDPSFRPGVEAPGASPRHIGVTAASYLGGVAKWGSLAASLPEVRRLPPTVRDRADVVLARSLGLGLAPAGGAFVPGSCARAPGGQRPLGVRLPPGAAFVRSLGGGGGELALRRFGESFAASAGSLDSRARMLLEIPSDAASDPWWASVPPGGLEVCAAATPRSSTERYCQLTRRLERPGGRSAAQKRALFAELQEVAPPGVATDFKTVIVSALSGRNAEAARAAQRRIDAFGARRCGR